MSSRGTFPPSSTTGSGGVAASGLLEAHRFLRRGPVSAEGWSQLVAKDRAWERSYRGRWSHDKVVRSTHGVNCTGSCSWQVFVKDGLITWESQAVDYPSIGAQTPEYEPRGCPRGASFSWYTYSPWRLRYPYVRGGLIEMFREARDRLGDPVAAWAEIVDDPQRSRRYKRERGKGGFVRASWEEASELIAAAHVHTIDRYGPDQTDVPESGDWWNSSYLVSGHQRGVQARSRLVSGRRRSGHQRRRGGRRPGRVLPAAGDGTYVKGLTGSYTLGFFLLAGVAVACLVVLAAVDRGAPRAGASRSALAP